MKNRHEIAASSDNRAQWPAETVIMGKSFEVYGLRVRTGSVVQGQFFYGLIEFLQPSDLVTKHFCRVGRTNISDAEDDALNDAMLIASSLLSHPLAMKPAELSAGELIASGLIVLKEFDPRICANLHVARAGWFDKDPADGTSINLK